MQSYYIYQHAEVLTLKEFLDLHAHGVPAEYISFPSSLLPAWQKECLSLSKGNRSETFIACYLLTKDRKDFPQSNIVLIELFKNAFLYHDPEALYLIAFFYLEGYLLPRSAAFCIEMLKQSAAFNYAPASFELGICYYHGIGVQRNLEKARQAFLNARVLNDIEVDVYLAVIGIWQAKTAKEIQAGMGVLEELEARGSSTASFFLGNACILYGEGEDRLIRAGESFEKVTNDLKPEAEEMLKEISEIYRSLKNQQKKQKEAEAEQILKNKKGK